MLKIISMVVVGGILLFLCSFKNLTTPKSGDTLHKEQELWTHMTLFKKVFNVIFMFVCNNNSIWFDKHTHKLIWLVNYDWK